MNTFKIKTVNEVARAYTYYLEPKIKQIYGMWKNSRVSLANMKKNIFNYVYDAAGYYYTESGEKVNMKKAEFLDNINKMTSKEEIYWYCNNSIRRARATMDTVSYRATLNRSK